MNSKNNNGKKVVLSLSTILIAVLILQTMFLSHVFAATMLLNRSDRMGSASAGAITEHQVRFSLTDFSTPVGSIRVEFCSNDPIPEFSCTLPIGFDASSRTLLSQAGETGFGIHANSDVNNIVLSRVASSPTVSDVVYEFGDIQNPTNQGTFYIRLYTYSSVDGTGVPVQSGGIALTVNRQFVVASEVPPFLRFCVGVTLTGFDCSSASNFLIDLGEFSTSQTKFGQAEMVAVTNAAFGLNITIGGTTLTSGNNTISPLTVQTPSNIGVSQFGINLRANTNPGIGANPSGPGIGNPTAAYNTPNQYRFQPGDVVANAGGPNDYRKFTVSYIANIDASQQPGVYATTISFICLANF